MKKQLRKFICSIIAVVTMSAGINVFAVAPGEKMQMKWRGDYSDNSAPQLVVEFTTPANYRQQITAVVYPDSVSNPSLSDYVQINEITVNGGTTAEVVFDILNTYTANDGKYRVALDGSGYMREECTDSVPVDVIKPSLILPLLSEFNGATSSSFGTSFNKVKAPLQLTDEEDGARKTKRINIVINTRTSDYNGAFINLENIRNEWIKSDTVAYLTDNSATAEVLKSKIEANAELFGIDTTDTDYITYIDLVCQDILSFNSEYNNGAGVRSSNDFAGIINQYIGLRKVNSASSETLYGAFDTYKSYFGIPADKLAIYNGYQADNKTENCELVLRDLYQKNFTKNSELVSAFVNAINELGNQTPGTSTPPVIVVPSGGGNSGGSSVPGAPSVAPTQPTVTPGVASFSDVPQNHWAYPYVTELATKKIIGGYDDGTFKPNNNVTREEFVKMIIGAAGLVSLDKECDFADVPGNAWYYDYVASAYNAGIVSGVSDTAFGVGTNITRQDVAVIASRVLSYLGKTPTVTAETTLTDIDTVADYATDSVKLLNGIGIINGYDDGSFMPKNTLTRAEAATIICKLINSL